MPEAGCDPFENGYEPAAVEGVYRLALAEKDDEIKQLREELEALRLIYPEGTADRINFLEQEIARLRQRLAQEGIDG